MSFESIRGMVRRAEAADGAEFKSRVLTRDEMLAEFLQEGGALGKVWHVGSDPTTNPLMGLASVVLPEATRSGFVSWLQGPGALEGMTVQPFHHPEFGLWYDPVQGKVTLDKEREEELVEALTSEGGFDFHPEAAKGWHALCQAIEKVGYVGKGGILKTHVATLRCCQGALTEEVQSYQDLILGALMKGHLETAKAISEKVIVSFDDPEFDFVGLQETLHATLGDEFVDGRLAGWDSDPGFSVMRALHSCGSMEGLVVMRSGAFDVIHFDAFKYGLSPILGDGSVLQDFLNRGGCLAIGGIPQGLGNMAEFAKKNLPLPVSIIREIEERGEYRSFEGFLYEKMTEATGQLLEEYRSWIQVIARESGLKPQDIKSQVFVSATCGYGSNPNEQLREFSYQWARGVAQALAEES